VQKKIQKTINQNASLNEGADDDEDFDESMFLGREAKLKKKQLDDSNAEYKKIKEELLKSKRATNVLTGTDATEV
jgi:hypothetical protein